MTDWKVLQGDCIEVMRGLEAGSVDCVVTSPPYAMQRKDDYGGVPESEYAGWTVVWMHEVRRLLKPSGSVIINIREHVRKGQIDDYVHRTRLALRWSGWFETDELIWVKPCSMPTGPFTKPRRSWERLLWFALSAEPHNDSKANGQPSTRLGLTTKDVSANYAERAGLSPELKTGMSRSPDYVNTYAKRSNGDTASHCAAYPIALAEWCVKLLCPEGGTVLDPFSGSGTTGVACVRNGFNYIGIERDGAYAEASADRIDAEAQQEVVA